MWNCPFNAFFFHVSFPLISTSPFYLLRNWPSWEWPIRGVAYKGSGLQEWPTGVAFVGVAYNEQKMKEVGADLDITSPVRTPLSQMLLGKTFNVETNLCLFFCAEIIICRSLHQKMSCLDIFLYLP